MPLIWRARAALFKGLTLGAMGLCTDRYLRRLEAMMAVADKDVSLVLSGTGDVLEPEDGLIGIGSGGSFALAAARALMDIDGLDAEAIARRGLEIAAGICIYTNENVVLEKL